MPPPALRNAVQSFGVLRQTPRILKMPDPRGNIAAGATVVSTLPVGLTYHAIQIQFLKASNVPATEAEIIAQVSRVRLTVDGDPKIDLTGTEAAMLANFYCTRGGAAAIQGGVLPVWLARPWWPEFASQDGPAWGTLDVGAFTLEITYTGTVTIVAQNVRASVTKGEPLGRHICVRRLVDNQAAAGLKVVSDFKADVTKQLCALHIDKAAIINTGPINTYQIRVDQAVEWEGEYEHLIHQYRQYELTPQTGFAHFCFAMRGRPIDALPMVMQDMRLELTTQTALGNFNVLQEVAEGLTTDEAA